MVVQIVSAVDERNREILVDLNSLHFKSVRELAKRIKSIPGISHLVISNHRIIIDITPTASWQDTPDKAGIYQRVLQDVLGLQCDTPIEVLSHTLPEHSRQADHLTTVGEICRHDSSFDVAFAADVTYLLSSVLA